MKLINVQKHRIAPTSSGSKDRNTLSGVTKGKCTGKSLSNHNEARTSNPPKLNQNIIPSGVIMVLNLLLVVANLYIVSAHLSDELKILLLKAASVKCTLPQVSRQEGPVSLTLTAKLR